MIRGFAILMMTVLTNEISILEVEPIQLVACLLRVANILVNDKSGTL
jgi:hypothetical protein